VFRPAPGAKVVTGEVLLDGAGNMEFQRMRIGDYQVNAGSHDVVFRDVATRFFFIRSSDRISIIGGSVGGITDGTSATVGSAYESTEPARDILIDGVSFHDMTRASVPEQHAECLFIQSVDGFVLRNSTFRRCDVFDVYANNIDVGPQLRNVVIEYSLYISNSAGERPLEGLVIRNNSFLQGFHLDVAGYTHSRVVANISPLEQAQCTPGIEWAYNVFDNAACGPTDVRAPLGYTDAATGDVHLAEGAAAIDLDRSASAPATDIDGDKRPIGAAADAGADERSGS
jgi:hypothetical protein